MSFLANGTTVTLDGTGSSDPSNQTLSYAWEILSFQPASGDPPANAAVLVGADTATPTFDVTAIDQLGTYSIQLTVSNGTLATADQVTVVVAKSFPVAGALLGGGILASIGAALRRQWQKTAFADDGIRRDPRAVHQSPTQGQDDDVSGKGLPGGRRDGMRRHSCLVCAGGRLWAQIEEIVVTSRKKEENLQDITVFVAAFDSATIEKLGLSSTADVVA